MILREVRLDQVEAAVAVEIAGVDAHAGLFAAVAADGDARGQRLFHECAVLAIAEEQAGRRVARRIDIRPPVVVQIGEEDAEAVVAGLRRRPPDFVASTNVPLPVFR